jgi:hypothetical protein
MTRAVSVDELQRAWSALEGGQFRASAKLRSSGSENWSPTEIVVVVVGAAGRVGATTVALAMGEVASGRVRLVECAPPDRSGLAYATSAELGDAGGWRRGSREALLVERPLAWNDEPSPIPAPIQTERDLTILEIGTAPRVLGWADGVVATAPQVIVTVATIPGLRALDRLLEPSRPTGGTSCVVVGPNLGRWPKQLRLSMTHRVRDCVDSGQLFTVPEDPRLRLTGLTASPLPRHVASACAPILDQLIHRRKDLSC